MILLPLRCGHGLRETGVADFAVGADLEVLL